MDMIQTLNAQLVMMMFFALIPMLGMMQARRAQRGKIRLFMSDAADPHARRTDPTRLGGRS